MRVTYTISPAVAGAPAAAAGPPRAFHDAGSAQGGGGRGLLDGLLGNIGSKLKNALLFAGMGAAAGIVLPIIPGGPVGGALIGAAISLLL